MNTELDKVKSSITISLGLKNRLRDAKGSAGYEEFIAQLLRMRNEKIPDGNYIELQKFQRREKVHSFDDLKVIFLYNKFNQSHNFVFDIQIDSIRKDGTKLAYEGFGSDGLQFEYKLYFELLSLAIQTELEPLFRHKGRFEDYYSWQKEFNLLGLPKNSFDTDVMEKLTDFKSGVHFK